LGLVEINQNNNKKMKNMINVWFNWQIVIGISWGKNYQKRPYVCIDLPFVIIQFFLKKPPNMNFWFSSTLIAFETNLKLNE
jgi:hypothetical protein